MTREVNVEMQETALAALSRNGGFKFTPTFFPYTSGQIGPYYIQSGDVMKNGEDYRKAITDMVIAVNMIHDGKIPKDLVISGGETRDWIFSNPLGSALGVPTVMIYNDGKMVGASMKDRLVLPIADLNNEGSSPKDKWIPAIKKEGGRTEKILFYVDRLEDGAKVMEDLGLESNAIAPLDAHAWDYLQKLPGSGVTPEIYRSLMQRRQNKEHWAENMLRSDAGLETLAALLASQKTREKGLKVLNVGYPVLKDELVDRLKQNWPGVVRGI